MSDEKQPLRCLPTDVVKIIEEYAGEMKLLPWIDEKKLDWDRLSSNPAAIDLIRANLDKVDCARLSRNPAAIDLLKANLDKVNWFWLSNNPAAIDILKVNVDKIKWDMLSKNPAIFEPVPMDLGEWC